MRKIALSLATIFAVVSSRQLSLAPILVRQQKYTMPLLQQEMPTWCF